MAQHTLDQCSFQVGKSDSFIAKTMVNFAYPEAGSFIMSGMRIVVFLLLVVLNHRNKKLLAKRGTNNVRLVEGLILPSYSHFVYLLTAANLCSGCIDLILSFSVGKDSYENLYIMPLEMGAFSCLYQGLAIFLIMMGAGYKSFKRAFRYGAICGMGTTIFFFVLLAIYEGKYNIAANLQQGQRDMIVYYMIMIYWIVLLIFYLVIMIVPLEALHCYKKFPARRRALTFYVRFNVAYYIFWIVSTSILQFNSNEAGACTISALALGLLTILQPLAVLKTLQIDSLYWQGAGMEGIDANNPLRDVWDHVDVETATSLGDVLGKVDRKQGKFATFIHFGLFQLDEHLGYIAGGFSRVYFATFNSKKVALKIVFHMELTPHDCQEFLKEAELLHALRHPNVVNTLGISVMPPVMALVLEYCQYGSLFDFLHKKIPKKDKKSTSTKSIDSTTSSLSSPMHHGALSTILEGDGDICQSPSPNKKANKHTTFNLDANHLNGDGGGNHDAETGDPQSKATTTPKKKLRISFKPEVHPIDPIISSEGLHDLNMSDGNWKSQNSPESSHKVFSVNSPMSPRLNGPKSDRPGPGGEVELQNPSVSFSASSSSRPSLTSSPTTHTSSRPSSLNRPSVVVGGSAGGGSNQRPSISNNPVRSSFFGMSMSQSFAHSERNTERKSSLFGRVSEVIWSQISSHKHPPEEALFDLPLGQQLSSAQRLRMMCDVAKGLAHLHSMQYMHCDIKSLNFLVSENYTVKISDFGETRKIGQPPKNPDVPPIPARNWAPPEVLAPGASATSYTIESDVFGVAMVLAEIALALDEPPFGDLRPEIMSQSEWYEYIVDDFNRPSLPSWVKGKLRASIESCWKSNPRSRDNAEYLAMCVQEALFNLQMPSATEEDQ